MDPEKAMYPLIGNNFSVKQAKHGQSAEKNRGGKLSYSWTTVYVLVITLPLLEHTTSPQSVLGPPWAALESLA
jgi:hypothetical protein